MTEHDDDSELVTIGELVAYLAEHVHEVPRHRRLQARLTLEKVERLIPMTTPTTKDAP